MNFRTNHQTRKHFLIRSENERQRKIHEDILREMEEPITVFKGYTLFANKRLEEIKREKVKLDNVKVNSGIFVM